MSLLFLSASALEVNRRARIECASSRDPHALRLAIDANRVVGRALASEDPVQAKVHADYEAWWKIKATSELPDINLEQTPERTARELAWLMGAVIDHYGCGSSGNIVIWPPEKSKKMMVRRRVWTVGALDGWFEFYPGDGGIHVDYNTSAGYAYGDGEEDATHRIVIPWEEAAGRVVENWNDKFVMVGR